MLTLVMGANAPLNTSRFDVVIEWPMGSGALDTSAYLLAAAGKVRSDEDMIFYNQKADRDGSVEITEIAVGRTQLSVDLQAVPREIERIVMCVTVDEPGVTMTAFQGLSIMIRSNGETQMRFTPSLSGAREVALRLVEIYRRNGTWKVRADGQGYNDGLAPLARSFGIDVAEEDAAPAHAPISPLPRDSHRPAPIPATTGVRDTSPQPRTPPSKNDGAVRMEGDAQTHNWLIGPEDHLGALSAKLAWTSQCGGAGGRPRALELALGCLYELQDGRRGAIQAWNSTGQFDGAPFMQLLPVDSRGVEGSQKLRINGDEWHHINRLALYTFIPHGAPSWRSASVSLEITATNRQQIVVDLNHGSDGCGMLGLLVLENQKPGIKFTRLARFFLGHQELDRELGWGLTWRTHKREGSPSGQIIG